MATTDDAVMGGLGSSLRTYREFYVSVNWISSEPLWVAPDINDYCKRYQFHMADRASAEADRERSQQGAAIAANSSRSRKCPKDAGSLLEENAAHIAFTLKDLCR